MISDVYNVDCLEYMRTVPDNFFSLAIDDPPYGIKRSCFGKKKKWKYYKPKDWDERPPDKEYFDELFRISKNQIIFGGNYFTPHLPSSMGWIVWDKGQKLTMSDGELVYTSFNRALRIVTLHRTSICKYGGYIHPTQKPVDLYLWILERYAKPGDKVLDTHLGSGSSRIAAYLGGFDFCGCEKDEEYFSLQENRFNRIINLKKDVNEKSNL